MLSASGFGSADNTYLDSASTSIIPDITTTSSNNSLPVFSQMFPLPTGIFLLLQSVNILPILLID